MDDTASGRRRDKLLGVLDELAGDGVGTALRELAFPAALVDRDGVVHWENAAAVETSGSARGTPFPVLVKPEARADFERWFDAVMRRREAAEHVADLKLSDGGYGRFEISVVPLREDGFIVGAFGMGSLIAREPPSGAAAALTKRQSDVLRLLGEGKSTAQIAGELVLSETTVRNHVAAILAELGVHTRLQAVLKAHRTGLLDRH